MWSRQHSPLLLQTTSTSPVELYHAALKYHVQASFGLIGACMTVSSVDANYSSHSKKTRLEFWIKKATETQTYPFLAGFPYPVQLLMIDEIHAVNKRIEEGKGTPNHTVPVCHCQFFRKYLIPCRHLFHCDLLGDFLTNTHWESFQRMSAESGFDVYISSMRVMEE